MVIFGVLLNSLIIMSVSHYIFMCLSENMQGSLLYILPLPNNRVVKLFTVYNVLHNIFIEKENIMCNKFARPLLSSFVISYSNFKSIM